MNILNYSDEDLEPIGMPILAWGEGNAFESLEILYRHVIERAIKTIKWYLNAKAPKRYYGRFLRIAALVLATTGGIIPVVAQIVPRVQPAWSSIILIIAAALVTADYLLGFSRGWMRYMETALRLHSLLDDFQYEWEKQRITWSNNSVTPGQLNKALTSLQLFVQEINSQVRNETSGWAAEFTDSLKSLDAAARVKSEVPVTRNGE